jgi:hypothetical protein
MTLKQLIQASFLIGAIALLGGNSFAKEPTISYASTSIGVQPFAQRSGKTSLLSAAMSPENKTVLTKVLKDAKKLKLCSDSLDLEAAKRASEVHKLGNQQYFVIVQCFLAAYQGNYEFLLVNQQPGAKKPITKLTVTEFRENEAGKIQKAEASSIGGLPTYDPKQRLLTINSKYRGLGDCGSRAKYKVETNKLRLVEFKAKFACDGKLEPYQTLYKGQ